MFSEESLARYKRNLQLPEIGAAGQEKLLQARVLIIGAGGLGSPAAYYLAAAGVGTIGIADCDVVDVSNLQRQILHFTADIGRPKPESAREKLLALNPGIKVIPHAIEITAGNISGVIRNYDFVIDATDNFTAKFLINDQCVQAGIPFSHAGIREWEGQTITVKPRESACYRCLFAAPPAAGAIPPGTELGVLGGVAGLIGTIQAIEAVKMTTAAGTPLLNTLLCFDARLMNFRKICVKRNPECPACGV